MRASQRLNVLTIRRSIRLRGMTAVSLFSSPTSTRTPFKGLIARTENVTGSYSPGDAKADTVSRT